MKILVLSWFISLLMTTTLLKRSRNLTVQLLHLLCKPVSKITTSIVNRTKKLRSSQDSNPKVRCSYQLSHWNSGIGVESTYPKTV